MPKEVRLWLGEGTMGGDKSEDGDCDDGNKRDSDGDDEEAPV